jgi:6-pyruvoyl-tetrahydropterin synthase related domain
MIERADPERERPEPLGLASLSSVGETILQALRRPTVLFLLSLIALVVLSIPLWRPLTQPGYVLGQEFGMPPILLFEMDRCFDDGQLPCRWTPDVLHSYGVPAFNYHGPLPYYVGEVIHLAGAGFLDSVMALYIIAFLLSGFFMFLLARQFWGNLGGLVAAAFFVYAPWQASLVYVQSNLASHWALAFFPAVLWAAYMVIKEGKPGYVLLLSLFTCALLLSHSLLATMLIPLALAWSAAFIIASKDWQKVIHLAIAEVVALSLAAFFVMPLLLERDLVHSERATSGYYEYADHFPRLKQLFLSRFWGYWDSRIGDGDGMSFQIGWLHWAIAFGSLLIAPFLWRRNRTAFYAAAVCFACFWLTVFLMHPRSDFLWRNFGALEALIFPWRLLALTILTSSFLAGAAVLIAKRQRYLQVTLAIALIAAVIGLNQEFFSPGSRWPAWGQFAGAEWANEIYTDAWTITQPDYAAVVPEGTEAPPKVQVLAGDAEITGLESGSSSLVFAANTAGGARLRTAISDFPHWRVKLDGQTIPHDHDNEFAAITFHVPPGSHELHLRLEDTTVRKFANYWSLAAWVLFFSAAAALLANGVWSSHASTKRDAGAISHTAELER